MMWRRNQKSDREGPCCGSSSQTTARHCVPPLKNGKAQPKETRWFQRVFSWSCVLSYVLSWTNRCCHCKAWLQHTSSPNCLGPQYYYIILIIFSFSFHPRGAARHVLIAKISLQMKKGDIKKRKSPTHTQLLLPSCMTSGFSFYIRTASLLLSL